MQPKQKSDVKIDYGPEIPKTVQGTAARLVDAAEDIVRQGKAYLGSGDFDDARHLLNAFMRMKVMDSKGVLPKFMADISGGYPPMTDEERAAALKELNDRPPHWRAKPQE